MFSCDLEKRDCYTVKTGGGKLQQIVPLAHLNGGTAGPVSCHAGAVSMRLKEGH